MVFDPRLALTFAVVAEEMSFTRAAERLGVAQPWVSEQVRRLEDRLKRRLLVRTSRHTELTAEGRAFLPYAQAMARTNDAAQRWASELRSGRKESLRLGAVDFVTEYPERTELINRFMHGHPGIELQVINGAADELLKRMLLGELDAVIAFTTTPDSSPDIQVASRLCRRVAGILAPREDPLAELDCVPLSAVAGHVFVTSPGRSDPVALRATYSALVSHGAELFPAPEPNRKTIENLARARRWCCLRWTVEREPRQQMGDMTFIPLRDDPLILEPAVLVPANAGRNPLVEDLSRISTALYAEAAEPGLKSPFG
ncbi:MAG: LysR family transcriptional regulator [Caulobacter sp.]